MWVQALSKSVSSIVFVAAKAAALAGLLFVAACAENKPPAPEVQATPGGVEAGSPQDFLLNVGDRVFFAENSAELSSTSIASLDKQAAWLLRFTSYSITVEGHSDEKGDVKKNRRLSEQRAKAVQNYLVSKGIESSRIHVVFYGRENRVAKCNDVSCWSQNRRVVTILRPAAEPALRSRGQARPQQSETPRMPVYASPPQGPSELVRADSVDTFSQGRE